MARSFADIAFTPAVRAFQARMGSRAQYAALDAIEARGVELGEHEAAFIEGRDGFYQATVGENGWPYVQFRGGPAGFLRVLDTRTIGYADFRGNLQYISAGNLGGDGRIALILMDYAQRRRLKIWGRARLVDARDDEALIARLEVPAYRARVERAGLISVEAFDWNCPQHITPRYTRAEAQQLLAERAGPGELGRGPLALVVAGMQELTPRVRSYLLRSADGGPLPAIAPGAHLDLPVPIADGSVSTRRYSIASNPARRNLWEIAVLREDAGGGGSAALHAHYTVGLRLNVAPPGNDFALHTDARPALLIAGGIGITPIRAMAHALQASGRDFHLHYAARSRHEMAWAEELAHELGARLSRYFADKGERLDAEALLSKVPDDALVYVCGPARLIDDVYSAARRLGLGDRIRSERFGSPRGSHEAPIAVELHRSGRRVDVRPGQTILEAVEAAGVAAPFSCRAGHCGRCATKVLAGSPLHLDSALSDAERELAGLMCICVSRARSAGLVLDL